MRPRDWFAIYHPALSQVDLLSWRQCLSGLQILLLGEARLGILWCPRGRCDLVILWLERWVLKWAASFHPLVEHHEIPLPLWLVQNLLFCVGRISHFPPSFFGHPRLTCLTWDSSAFSSWTCLRNLQQKPYQWVSDQSLSWTSNFWPRHIWGISQLQHVANIVIWK